MMWSEGGHSEGGQQKTAGILTPSPLAGEGGGEGALLLDSRLSFPSVPHLSFPRFPLLSFPQVSFSRYLR